MAKLQSISLPNEYVDKVVRGVYTLGTKKLMGIFQCHYGQYTYDEWQQAKRIEPAPWSTSLYRRDLLMSERYDLESRRRTSLDIVKSWRFMDVMYKHGIDKLVGNRVSMIIVDEVAEQEEWRPEMDMRVVAVRFDGDIGGGRTKNTDYHYLAPDDLGPIEVGERVIVESPYNGYVCVSVRDILTPRLSVKATKYVVSKIDDAAYKERIANAQRRAAIVKRLEQIDKELEVFSRFKRLALDNEEAASLYAELQHLGGVNR